MLTRVAYMVAKRRLLLVANVAYTCRALRKIEPFAIMGTLVTESWKHFVRHRQKPHLVCYFWLLEGGFVQLNSFDFRGAAASFSSP